ncbi:mandelate racemase/muconate lactonizing enzyme family protein [Streptomonospora litoralis]|uniref:mandelate racemase/muconate lactonizing enzyme family protein n=1 Tax=Streptomonospora litoralis TaxID=2498135 RepID=UPI0013F14627|nr:mandelate racemase/muconate lactonizing enzyme family protein [Streptomonospora litoralis]
MKIVAVETLRTGIRPNLCFVQLHTDTGAVGLGEAFYGPAAVEGYLHEQAAPELLGQADPAPEPLAHRLRPYTGYQGSGAETRGNGAVDMAAWDLLGQRAGMPLVDLLGGAVHESVPVYNTCAGARYVAASSRQESDNWGMSPEQGAEEPFEDLRAFLHRPGELAAELRAEGIGGMKIWPFDQAAERSGGAWISHDDLARGVGTVESVREAVGFDMEVMVELHGLWYPAAAAEICRALQPLRPAWVEDPVRPDAAESLARLRSETGVRVAAGETCTGRRAFLPLLAAGAVDVVTVDPGWTGGVTEAHKVASLADAHGAAVAPHDCTGPVSLGVATHLVCNAPNGLVQESVRAFLRTWYPLLAEGLPEIAGGRTAPTRAPGHGIRLRPEFLARTDTRSRVTRL